jgi:hypothetical protein
VRYRLSGYRFPVFGFSVPIASNVILYTLVIGWGADGGGVSNSKTPIFRGFRGIGDRGLLGTLWDAEYGESLSYHASLGMAARPEVERRLDNFVEERRLAYNNLVFTYLLLTDRSTCCSYGLNCLYHK